MIYKTKIAEQVFLTESHINSWTTTDLDGVMDHQQTSTESLLTDIFFNTQVAELSIHSGFLKNNLFPPLGGR